MGTIGPTLEAVVVQGCRSIAALCCSCSSQTQLVQEQLRAEGGQEELGGVGGPEGVPAQGGGRVGMQPFGCDRSKEPLGEARASPGARA